MCKALRSWWRDKYIYRSKTVTMTTKCKRVHSHVFSTVLNGSINWPWSGAVINKVRAWESQILRFTFRPRRMPDESWVTYKIRTSRFMRICWRKVGLPLLSHNVADKIWTTMTWAVFDGGVPVMLALRSLLGLRTTAWWRSRSSWGMAWDPNDVQRWKHKVGFHNRGVQWDTDGEMGGRSEVLDTTDDANATPEGGCHSEFARVDETRQWIRKRSPKDLCRQRNQELCLPSTLEHLVPGDLLTLEIKGGQIK